jgi:hypothetical protein
VPLLAGIAIIHGCPCQQGRRDILQVGPGRGDREKDH